MPPNPLDRVLLIANPASQSGNGAKAAKVAASIFRKKLDDRFELVFTAKPNHASEIAANAKGFTSVIALGGDGAVHEIANGLMQINEKKRPCLGLVPVGSGNDYARSLNIPTDIDKACSIVLQAGSKPVDIGCVNGAYFVETLSFGLDAAIALDTMERRKKTGRHGTALYMESGFEQLRNHRDIYDYTLTVDKSAPIQGQSLTFAVQIGPYYGGGFKICPDAKVDSGEFDLCISHPPFSLMKAAYIFLKAKNGRHINEKQMELLNAKHLKVSFTEEPPAQFDGEKITGCDFDITVMPGAIDMFRP